MRAISLPQPWASAVALGSKTIDTRSWSTTYRGPIAIHAAAREMYTKLYWYHGCESWQGALASLGFGSGDPEADINRLPRGAIIAVGTLVDCRPAESFTPDEIDRVRDNDGRRWTERMLGHFGSGRYGWVLRDVRRMHQPIRHAGRPGLFHIPDELLAPVLEVAV